MKFQLKISAYPIQLIKIALILIIVLIYIANTSTIIAENAQVKIKLNEPTIDFILDDANGNSFSLKQERGKIVVLSIAAFGNSKEMREKYFKENKFWIEAIKLKYDTTCIIVGMGKLNISPFLKPVARKKIRENHDVRFITDWKGDIYDSYGNDFYPTVILIDKEGIVREIVVGLFTAVSAYELFQKIDTLLNQ